MEIHVIQCFKLLGIFNKGTYNHQNRQETMCWPSQLNSTAGYLDGDILVMSSDQEEKWIKNIPAVMVIMEAPDINPATIRAGMVPERFRDFSPSVLIEEFRPVLIEEFRPYFYFKRPFRSGRFETFELSQSPERGFELLVDPPNKKGGHKIADLLVRVPVKYLCNHKIDFSLTGRRERSYWEYEYIIEYVGVAREIDFSDKPGKAKKILTDPLKAIDKRQILY